MSIIGIDMSLKIKKDAFKYLGIVVDFRLKKFKELGKEATIRYIQEELNKNKEYLKTVEKRKKQIITQKKYNENIKKVRYIGNIEVVYELKVERERREKEEGQSKKHKGKLVKYFQQIPKTINIRFDKEINKTKILYFNNF